MYAHELFLNDVAGTEILVIFLVILLFFGSKSIPGIAKSMGRALFEFRNATNDIKNEIKKSGDKVKGDLNLKDIVKETEEELVRPLDQAFTDVDHAIHYQQNPKINVKKTITHDNNSNSSGDHHGEQVGLSDNERS